MAGQRDRWVGLNRYYYQDLESFYRTIVPPGSRVLELGSGNGDLLAALRPSRGVGIDFSPAFVLQARERHPGLSFLEMDAEALSIEETFDYVLLAGTLGYLADIQQVLTGLHRVCTPETRIIATFRNSMWEPVLRFGERIGQRMPLPAQSWLSGNDIANLLHLTG